MNKPTRKLAVWIGTVLLVLLVAYPLSYAPYLRWRYSCPDMSARPAWAYYDSSDVYFTRNRNAAYSPVEWLIDETLLKAPLMAWGRLWGVEDKMTRDSLERLFEGVEL